MTVFCLTQELYCALVCIVISLCAAIYTHGFYPLMQMTLSDLRAIISTLVVKNCRVMCSQSFGT